MKKLAMLALLLSLGTFAVGCAQQEDASTAPAPTTTETAPPADTATPPAEGAPAEGGGESAS